MQKCWIGDNKEFRITLVKQNTIFQFQKYPKIILGMRTPFVLVQYKREFQLSAKEHNFLTNKTTQFNHAELGVYNFLYLKQKTKNNNNNKNNKNWRGS